MARLACSRDDEACMAEDRPDRATAFARGLRKRCPRCGGGDLFASFTRLKPRCPTCNLRFEREDGYFLGAMMVSIGVVELVFGVLFITVFALTYPDVPWTPLLVGLVVVNLVVPLAIYPWTKTAWMGLDHAFFPTTVAEEADALLDDDGHDPAHR